MKQDKGEATPVLLLITHSREVDKRLRSELRDVGLSVITQSAFPKKPELRTGHPFAFVIFNLESGADFQELAIILATENCPPVLCLIPPGMVAEALVTTYALGCLDHVIKPFRSTILRAKVARILQVSQRGQELDYTKRLLFDEKQNHLERDIRENELRCSLDKAVADALAGHRPLVNDLREGIPEVQIETLQRKLRQTSIPSRKIKADTEDGTLHGPFVDNLKDCALFVLEREDLELARLNGGAIAVGNQGSYFWSPGRSSVLSDNVGADLLGLHAEDKERVQEAVKRSLLPGKEGKFNIEYRVLGTQDGLEHWLSMKGHVFCGEDGTPKKCIGVAVNITQLKIELAAA